MVPLGVLFVPNYRGPPLLPGKRDGAVGIDQLLLDSPEMKDFLDPLKIARVHCRGERKWQFLECMCVCVSVCV